MPPGAAACGEDQTASELYSSLSGAHNKGRETSGSVDVNDFIDEDGEAEVDDG